MKLVPACLAAAALVSVGAATSGNAAIVDMRGQLKLHPISPENIKTYQLTNPPVQGASGLTAVGVGQPAYLDVLLSASISPTNVLSVTWTLTSRPLGSQAALAASPLGMNVPPPDPADVDFQQVAWQDGRRMLRPDVAGQYKVAASIVINNLNSTVVTNAGIKTTNYSNGTTNLTVAISASTYMGADVCRVCHMGGPQAPSEWPTWLNTPHASMFAKAIDGQKASYYSKNCISCHTVGYDANTNAVNGGFDDVAAQLGWTFPSVLTNGNWASMQANYPTLAGLANIQCENCHGPGSEHAYAFGNTNLSNWPRIGMSMGAGNCGQCHDALSHHVKNAEWSASRHAIATRSPSGPGRQACIRCHTAKGFVGYTEAVSAGTTYTTNGVNTAYEAITCATCHDPHDASNPYQLRLGEKVTLGDGTVVAEAGSGAFCMNCHSSRNGSVSNSIYRYPLGQQTWAGGSAFYPHDSPQGDMLMGANGWTYDKVIPSAAHRSSVSNTCAGCHMQEVASTSPAFLKAGGHTFRMTWNEVVGGVTNTHDLVEVCVKCHGEMEEFNMVKTDYNGDGVIEGVQTEVTKMLDKLATMLPNGTYRADGNYVADGLVKILDRTTTKTNWPAKFLKAAYNWMFVYYDFSKGIHNAPYAVGLLKASIADLTGDANMDGMPDAWQIQYFGSATDPRAAANANPAGDGLPNWLKYALGFDPTVKGTNFPGGVVWANGKQLYTSASTNEIKIYTAAEVAFNTEVGKTYQIQSISQIDGTWQPLGSPIAGTGNTISYVVPTRSKVQQFYRVVRTP